MIPANQDLHLTKGDHESWTFSVDAPAGTDLDISGYSDIIFTAYSQWGNTSLFEKRLSNGEITITNGVAGQFRVDVVPSDTSSVSLPKGRERVEYRYRIRFLTDSSAYATLISGRLFLYAD